MRRPKNYRQYIESPAWKERRAHFYELRFAAEAPHCENNSCNRYFVPLEAHHLTYVRLGCELPEDILFLCARCHRNFDSERTRRDREIAARQRAEKRRREIRWFKNPFKQLARRRGGSNPVHVRWYYRRFVSAWRACCDSLECVPPASESRRWFLRIDRYMRRREGRLWFTGSFEDAENAYLAFLEEHKRRRHRR